MTRLALATDASSVMSDYDELFLWDGSPGDSFKSKLEVSLDSLGAVTDLNADFVRAAVAIYASDHTVRRKFARSSWNRRVMDLTVPVSSPDTWASISAELGVVTKFLTGDDWTFHFTQLPKITHRIPLVAEPASRVVLVSGGADSAVGALRSGRSLAEAETHVLVSHASSGVPKASQIKVYEKLETLFPGRQAAHHRIFLTRTMRRLDGTNYPTEASSRSRSLLFLALGLAVASPSKVELWIPENGFASLNPPLGPERLGALSTRTTQPWFLWKVGELLASIGAHGTIVNPFQLMTKGEMFSEVLSTLGPEAASTYLTATHSCSHTDQNYQAVPSGTHCGVCFGCIVRRASFKAAGVVDGTRYMSDEAAFSDYAASHSIEDAVKDFVYRDLSPSSVMTMPLPPNLAASDALSLCLRGQQELRSYIE